MCSLAISYGFLYLFQTMLFRINVYNCAELHSILEVYRIFLLLIVIRPKYFILI